MLLRGRLSSRRKVLFAGLAVLLLALGWAGWSGMAATRGVEARDMDWNGDGRVETGEILQSLYAVTAQREKQGNRECTTYRWYRGGEVIRVDCRTVLVPEAQE